MGERPSGKLYFDSFEFHTSTGELFRRGLRLRLADQNARLLLALLERPGTVVGRQELRSLIWPGGEHLDHDHAISNGINQLRSILRDNPKAPSFIETLPKRGYRFIAKVRFEPELKSDQAASLQFEVAGKTETALDRQPDLLPVSAPQLQTNEAIQRTEEVLAIYPAATDSAVGSEIPSARRPGSLFIYGLAAVALLILVVATGWFWSRRPVIAVGERPVILGIAPIETSGIAAQSIAEPFRLELVDAASQLPGVQVRAAHSFVSGAVDLAAIRAVAKDLQLDTLLLGKISSSDPDHFDFAFELVRGSDAVHLATFHYSGTREQLGRIRSEIQRDLFQRLSDTKRNRLDPVHSTENTQAYSEYLSARAELIQPTDEALIRAVDAFHHATQLDGSFVQAFAGLGTAYLLRAEHLNAGSSNSSREANYAAARTASATAVRLDPRDAEAHATLGFLEFRHDWNAAAAEPELKQAIELEPGQAMHRIMYALLLGNTGRFREALEQVDLARGADPLWPPIYLSEIYLASAARQNTRALDAAQRLEKLMPGWPLAYDQNAWAFWYAGRYENAVHEWIEMAKLEHDATRVSLEEKGMRVLRSEGVTAYSRLKLNAAQSSEPWKHPNDFQIAEWQLNAGERTKALDSLRGMIRNHDPEALQLGASPAYLSLHNDPAFNALLVQVGLPVPSRQNQLN
jgi:DNA-binding winged helix-turn-helix (wHTH) protein